MYFFSPVMLHARFIWKSSINRESINSCMYSFKRRLAKVRTQYNKFNLFGKKVKKYK